MKNYFGTKNPVANNRAAFALNNFQSPPQPQAARFKNKLAPGRDNNAETFVPCTVEERMPHREAGRVLVQNQEHGAGCLHVSFTHGDFWLRKGKMN